MGNIDSAAAASAIRATFPAIHLILVVGVCGVNPKLRDENGGEVLLGDVIISTGLVKAGSGRQYEDGVALRRQTELPPHVDVRAFLQKLQSAKTTDRLRTRTASYTSTLLESFNKEGMRPVPTEDKLFPSGYRHKHQNPDICDVCALCHGNSDAVCLDASVSSCEELGCDDTLLITRRRLQDATSKVSGNSDIANAQSPTLWFGPFASAEFVMKSGHHRDKLARENHVVAFEMEGGGTWEFLPTIIVKGACDYADSHKHKAWQQYSATTAAACAKAMVEEWRTIQPHLAYSPRHMQSNLITCYYVRSCSFKPNSLTTTASRC
ncbi:nucleoside phosphorylase domain-containing protein [Aspergillus karnatakaensis]|uniref:nucleoside phosphorylase domain-containing protein n=1 Tax=Aspergillus karnatakaensis TaxID=1810916 RepID=UPI003CCDFA8E